MVLRGREVLVVLMAATVYLDYPVQQGHPGQPGLQGYQGLWDPLVIMVQEDRKVLPDPKVHQVQEVLETSAPVLTDIMMLIKHNQV